MFDYLHKLCQASGATQPTLTFATIDLSNGYENIIIRKRLHPDGTVMIGRGYPTIQIVSGSPHAISDRG